MILTTIPRGICVSAKYVTVDSYDSNSGSRSITVAMKCRGRPAMYISSPAPHKPTVG